MTRAGNPSNQLAVVAQYQLDTLSSTYHYYRALSVRQPFSTARTNLEITYKKAVKRWFESDGGDHAIDSDAGARFRTAFVALHGVFFTKTRCVSRLLPRGGDFADGIWPRLCRLSDIAALSEYTQSLFREAVENRLLTSDAIVKVVVTGICALWQARAFRSSSSESAFSSEVRSLI